LAFFSRSPEAYEEGSSKRLRSVMVANELVVNVDVFEERAISEHPEVFLDSGIKLRCVSGE